MSQSTAARAAHGANGAAAALRLICDFDGVLADSQQAVFQALDRVAARKGVPPVSPEEYHNLSMRQILSRLRVRWYSLPRWIAFARDEVAKGAHLVTLHHEIEPLLDWARFTPVPVSIVSTNARSTIVEFLRKHLPQHPINEIIGGVSLFGKHRVLRKLAARWPQAVYIGDEVRDVEAARRAGMPSVAVTWGKDSPALLANARPDYQVSSADQLVHVARTLLNR